MGTLAAEKRREAHARDAHSSVASPPSTAGASAAKRAAARASPSSVSSSVAPAAATSLVMPAAKSRLTLERVIGMTSLSNAMMAVNPVTGEIAYSAGCIVVIYNLRRNKQVRYYRVEKSVACLCFSPNGQYLAIGEKGYSPAITIWNGTDGTLCAELQQHKYGVACMAFSRDGRYLLSAGLVHDQHMYAWDLTKDVGTGEVEGKAIGAAQIQEKVLSMDYCQEGNFFVSVGEKHFKFWFLDDRDGFLLTGYAINDIPEMQHRNAVMSTKAEATFTSVACGYGACRLKTFAVTSDGTLCCFGASCIMERLVSLEAAHGNAISVTEAHLTWMMLVK
uniref:Anaphase-promoting complex subunit 4 WD40 domain-containing protein n=1 Tax=Globisporangium ultimum (strain ATCC 200006 / CBS 805.95 / DAOM BR144) TaxID=431595 RepID=K3WRK3_GLOUD